MFAAHLRDGLRASLARRFHSLSRELTESTGVESVLDQLILESRLILSDLGQAWELEKSPFHRLPSEVFVLCFTDLSFRDRVIASHVSRRWCSISLAHPAVWGYVNLQPPFRAPDALLDMALNRTGTCPVILLHCRGPAPGIIGERSLMAHMHHIEQLSFSSGPSPEILHRPAPLLYHLNIRSGHMDVRADFLGGQPGQLELLYMSSVSVPETCPGFYTVTFLSLKGPSTEAYAATFTQLFTLFPALQSLGFLTMKREFAHFLPRGPAPTSLTEIVLETADMGYDTTEHYALWGADKLTEVELDQRDPPTERMPLLLAGATEISIGRRTSIGWTTSVSGVGRCFISKTRAGRCSLSLTA
ncbi:hypothetical protein AURDEDRAFT_171175 [Auricularia subglabra TFB-10046 SS5]|uniref:F-box domain-containing protein n=1 Tax=Auricularia subglabra (strain TFB-10046 / SS5) TaxID=717982 RepID=J0D1L2_AURST|nr:hypothetical protein AURDEDRAFT_171175 [Auricularia subglabra TFB-10046 SS5]